MRHHLMSSYHFNLIYVRKTIFSCRLVQVHLQPVLDFMFLSIADIRQLMSHKQQVSEEQSKSAFS